MILDDIDQIMLTQRCNRIPKRSDTGQDKLALPQQSRLPEN